MLALVSAPSVLIVDDSNEVLELHSQLARRAGLHPYTARSAEEGFRLFLEHRTHGMIAVMTDGHLEHCSGLDLALAIRALSPLPVILVSSDATFFVREAPPGLFYRAFFKPCRMVALQEALEAILASRQR